VGGIIFIFGKDNIYQYAGGSITPIPQNTLLKYAFENMNKDQRYKFFVWYNQRFNELHFHYTDADSEENNRAVIYSLSEGHWTPRDNIERSAGDTAGQVFDYPILASPTNGTYQHEVGYNDDGAAMEAYVQVDYEAIAAGKYMTEIDGIIPDVILTGDMTVELYAKEKPRSSPEVLVQSFTFSDTDTKIDCQHEVRWRSWRFVTNEVDGYFRMSSGATAELIQQGSEF
jgi:hypothetical protein